MQEKEKKIKFLEFICFMSWVMILGSLVLGFASHFIPIVFVTYSKVVKILFWGAWIFTSLSLLFLIYYQGKQKIKILKKNRVSKSDRVTDTSSSGGILGTNFTYLSLSPGSGLLAFLFVIINLLMIIESYLMLNKIVLAWIFTFILSLIFLINSIFPGGRILKMHSSFIMGLSISFFIFYTILISGVFMNSFLSSAGWIDRYIFAGIASRQGDNYNELFGKKIEEIFEPLPGNTGTTTGQVSTFPVAFREYVHSLQNNRLTSSLLPASLSKDGKSLHARWVGQALAILENSNGKGNLSLSEDEKQDIMLTLLDYLSAIIEKGYTASIHNDEDYPLGRRFLEVLAEILNRHGLAGEPAIRTKLEKFYQILKKETDTNTVVLEEFLGIT